MANGVGITVPSQQLNLVDSLSTPYGLKDLPPSLALKQQNINRRQHLANILLQRGIQPLQGQQAGRFYVPPHWSQGVSQLAQAGLGAYMTYKGSKDTEALGQENKDLLAQAVEDYRNQTADVPEVPPSQPPPAPAQAAPPAAPPQDPQAAVMEAMAGQSGQAAPQESATDTLSRLLPPPGDQPTGPWTGPIAVPGDGRSPSGPMLPPVPPGTPPPETPPIPSYANMSEMSGQSLSPPPDPRAQVAQAMAPPQAPMPGAMPSPAPAPMQGPMSPGTPGRARTPEEKRQVILQTLLANEHPQAQEMGKMLLNQMQHDENMKAQQDFQATQRGDDRAVRKEELGARREDRAEDRTLREQEIGLRHEEKKQLTDIQQKQFDLEYSQKERDIEAKHTEVQQRMGDARTTHAEQKQLNEQKLSLDRDRLSIERDKAVREKMPTDAQGAANLFASRADIAHQTLDSLEGQYSPLALDYKDRVGKTWIFGGALEAGANSLLSKEAQRADQSQRDFVNAVLRKESGAVINPDEFDNARKQYFPQQGDKPEVLEQKRRNRQTEIQGLRQMSGTLNPGRGAAPAAPTPAEGMTPTVPAFHDAEKQKRYEEFKKNHTP